mgnify:CR=1 FL=1
MSNGPSGSSPHSSVPFAAGATGTASEAIPSKGWQVTFAGMGINLALGVLYTWSVIAAAIPEQWGWNATAKNWPYMVACLVFSLTMVPAGRLQDRFGPRWVATIGGVLVGIGMILSSTTSSYWGWMIGFGILAGAGIGFGYASATPPAVKWFPPSRTGLIAGLVVAGFGLSAVYAALLAEAMTNSLGVSQTMLWLGIAFLIVVCGLSQLLVVPPKGYVPAGSPAAGSAAAAAAAIDFTPAAMLRTWQFYVLWFMYLCGAGAGLMIISKLKTIGSDQTSLEKTFILVAACAVGNGLGRIVLGMLSDKFGRRQTLFVCFLVQAGLMILLSWVSKGSTMDNLWLMAVVAALIGANYGANLAIFPSITKGYYGIKNFGVNYGLLFTAWGVGGFLLSLLVGRVKDLFGSFVWAYYISAGLLVVAALVTFVVNKPAPPVGKSSE